MTAYNRIAGITYLDNIPNRIFGTLNIHSGNSSNYPVATVATGITINSFIANWHIFPFTERYFLDVSSTNDFSTFVPGFNNLDVGLVNTYDISGLTPNTFYFYRVRAQVSGNISGNSNIINVKTHLTWETWYTPWEELFNLWESYYKT